jgi:hypothetical protein
LGPWSPFSFLDPIRIGTGNQPVTRPPPTYTQVNSVARVRERTILTERPPLVGAVEPPFADRESHEFSVTVPYGRILGFLDRTHTST